MDGPPYRCVFGDVRNIDVEVTFGVSTIVVDTNWEARSVAVLVNNCNIDFYVKFMGESKELGKGVCTRGGGGRTGWIA